MSLGTVPKLKLRKFSQACDLTYWLKITLETSAMEKLPVYSFRCLNVGKATITSIYDRERIRSRDGSVTVQIGPSKDSDMLIIEHLLPALEEVSSISAAYLCRVGLRGLAPRLAVGIRARTDTDEVLAELAIALCAQFSKKQDMPELDLFWMDKGNETLSHFVSKKIGPFYTSKKEMEEGDERFWRLFSRLFAE